MGNFQSFRSAFRDVDIDPEVYVLVQANEGLVLIWDCSLEASGLVGRRLLPMALKYSDPRLFYQTATCINKGYAQYVTSALEINCSQQTYAVGRFWCDPTFLLREELNFPIIVNPRRSS